MRDDNERLLDILDAINIIDKSLSSGKEIHALNELEFLGIVRCIEIIGEACNNLSKPYQDKYSEVPWRQIANMRNILIHQYFNVDIEKVEKVVKENLPKLKSQIQKILESK